MASVVSLETLASYRPLTEEAAVTESVAQAEEAPLALFIGVNHIAFFFTTQRFFILKQARRLARALAGQKMIDFRRAPVDLSLEDVLSQTQIKAQFPVAEVSYLDAERVYSAASVRVYLRGRKHELTLGHKQAEIAPYVEALLERFGIPRSAARLVMKRELRAWTKFTILTGSTSLLLSFALPGMLDPVWGLTLVIVGAGILCSAEPAMFIILGVGMIWAALMNLLGLNSSPLRGGSLPIAPMFQVYCAILLFAKYRKYKHLYDGWAEQAEEKASLWRRFSLARIFSAVRLRLGRSSASVAECAAMPLMSLAIAGIEVLLLLSLFEASFLRWSPRVISLLSHGHLHLAMVGGAVGVASLYSRRGARWAAIAGVMINALMAATIVSLLITGLVRK
jgi:hypothetical protein